MSSCHRTVMECGTLNWNEAVFRAVLVEIDLLPLFSWITALERSYVSATVSFFHSIMQKSKLFRDNPKILNMLTKAVSL